MERKSTSAQYPINGGNVHRWMMDPYINQGSIYYQRVFLKCGVRHKSHLEVKQIVEQKTASTALPAGQEGDRNTGIARSGI